MKYKALLLPLNFKTRTDMTLFSQNKRLTLIVLAVALILAIPLVAMQFTNEVNWDLSDFITMAGLLLGTGLAIELVIRKVKDIRYRIAICIILVVALLLVWAELAVGIFGTPLAGS